MNQLIFNKEPLVLVNHMDSYFKQHTPDCMLLSGDNHEIPVHKEILYQTKYLQSMINCAGFDAYSGTYLIEIMLPTLTKEELEVIVEFLYTGQIFAKNQAMANQVSENLTELLGFPQINFTLNPEPKFFVPKIAKKAYKPIIERPVFEVPQKSYNEGYDQKSYGEGYDEYSQLPENDNDVVVKEEKHDPDYEPEMDIPDPGYMEPYPDDNYQDDPNYMPLNVDLKEEENANYTNSTNETVTKAKTGRKPKSKVKRERKIDYERPKHECQLCGKQVGSNVKNHFRAHHKQTCHLCLKNFESKQAVADHISDEHTGKKPCRCAICGLRSHYMRNLQKHVRDYHKENICCKPEGFESKGAMMNHFLDAHIEFDCIHCMAQFSKEKELIAHLGTEHNIKYECPLCPHVFISTVTADQHRKLTHEYKREVPQERIPQTCHICSKTFSSVSAVNNHIKYIHQGKKKPRYQCELCEYSHCLKSGLKIHVESVHEGRKHICSYCGEEFNTQKKLDGHIAFNHDRSKLFKCPFCDAEYRFEHYMKDHIAYVHEKKVKHVCPQCGQSCLNQGDLNFHIRRMHDLDGKRPFECQECDRSYKMESALKLHVKTFHRGIKVKCPLCEKSFDTNKTVRRHIEAVHEKKRPHVCQLCGERFGQKSHLNTHMKGKHKQGVKL